MKSQPESGSPAAELSQLEEDLEFGERCRMIRTIFPWDLR